eukprot:TRINITY_DN1565_c1_g1_i9.p1 TRINITY_DN1565_c1_g1~~TRINITY_DN1565_c1_g1_i9.p1  ORF type:complete len:304 (-),score=90.12 TRINITY_DN1565_c1_g1_i9:1047-1958(-)
MEERGERGFKDDETPETIAAGVETHIDDLLKRTNSSSVNNSPKIGSGGGGKTKKKKREIAIEDSADSVEAEPTKAGEAEGTGLGDKHLLAIQNTHKKRMEQSKGKEGENASKGTGIAFVDKLLGEGEAKSSGGNNGTTTTNTTNVFAGLFGGNKKGTKTGTGTVDGQEGNKSVAKGATQGAGHRRGKHRRNRSVDMNNVDGTGKVDFKDPEVGHLVGARSDKEVKTRISNVRMRNQPIGVLNTTFGNLTRQLKEDEETLSKQLTGSQDVLYAVREFNEDLRVMIEKLAVMDEFKTMQSAGGAN